MKKIKQIIASNLDDIWDLDEKINAINNIIDIKPVVFSDYMIVFVIYDDDNDANNGQTE